MASVLYSFTQLYLVSVCYMLNSSHVWIERQEKPVRQEWQPKDCVRVGGQGLCIQNSLGPRQATFYDVMGRK